MILSNVITQSKNENIFLFLFFSLLAFILILPIFFIKHIPPVADYINHLALLIQAKKALIEGQFPLRVTPLEFFGWRYPIYQFLSPTSYLYGALIYRWITPSNPLAAMTIEFWSALILAGFYMYKLSYWLTKYKPAALAASITYLFSPYYIIVTSHLGNLNETLALGVLPAVVYFTLQHYSSPSTKWLLQASLSWYLLITIHIVTFAYTSLFLGMLLLFFTIHHSGYIKNFLSVSLVYGLSYILALWFIAPVELLSPLFKLSYSYTNALHFIQFHPSLMSLLSPFAIINNHAANALTRISPSVGWPILCATTLSIYTYLNKLSSGDTHADSWLGYLLIIFLIAFCMAWSPINFWKWLPQPLLIGQYSSRLLSQVSWIGALLFAWVTTWLFKNRFKFNYYVFFIFVVMISSLSWFPHHTPTTINYEEFIAKPYLFYNNDDYLIDFKNHTDTVKNIDNILIDSSHYLKLNTSYLINGDLLQYTVKPAVLIDGLFSENKILHQKIIAELNGKLISTLPITTGKFLWIIPLHKNQIQNSLQFSIHNIDQSKNNKLATTFSIKNILLSGFQAPSAYLSFNLVEPYCQQYKFMTQCKLFVPTTIKYLELPILYYPSLIQITLNNHIVPYDSILSQGFLMTRIQAQPGTINQITIQFRGLNWANNSSQLGWLIWIVIFISNMFSMPTIQLSKKSA